MSSKADQAASPASGDIIVHGFDALPGILDAKYDRMYLPLVKFLGLPEDEADGAKAIKFRLTSETGKPISVEAISVFRIADGKIAEESTVWDALGLLQQVGAVPAPA